MTECSVAPIFVGSFTPSILQSVVSGSPSLSQATKEYCFKRSTGSLLTFIQFTLLPSCFSIVKFTSIPLNRITQPPNLFSGSLQKHFPIHVPSNPKFDDRLPFPILLHCLPVTCSIRNH